MIPSVFPMLVGPATSSNTGTSQAAVTTAFGPMKGFDPSIGATAAHTPGTSSDFGQTPSTEGFLHVLDMLLTSSPMPQAGSTSVSNLLVQTSVTTTMGDLSKASTKEIQDPAATPLDPSLSAGIAALLQGLGFQVRPEQISQLSPMDRQQLESALEFASRNLQKGTDTTQVAEFTALLLPRPWPLDDRNGTPASTATAVQGQDVLPLPAGFIQSLDKIRAQLHSADLASASATVDSPLPTAPNVRWSDVAIAKPDQARAVPTTSTSALAAALNATPAPTSKVDSPPKSQDLSNPVPGSGVAKASATALASAVAATSAVSSDPGRASNPDSDPALQVLQGLQTSAPAKDQGTNGLVATDIQTRHLPPGGTASEFIGRQVLEKVQVQLSEGRRELSLRLWPDELGEVRLSLRMTEDEKVHAHMVVENDSVRQAMLDSMPQLRDALTRHGMDLEKMTVSVEQKDAGSAGQGSDDPGEFRDRAGKGARSGGFRDEEMSVAVPLTMGQDTGRRNGFNTIDLWS